MENNSFGTLAKTHLRDWTQPDGSKGVEMELTIKATPTSIATVLPWVRMNLEEAATLIRLIGQAVAAAQGVFEEPSGPLQ